MDFLHQELKFQKKYNQRILDVIGQIADEIEEELETNFSKLEE